MRLTKKLATLARLGNVAARLRQVFEAREIGFDHLLVDRDGKQQRDVDVEAGGDQPADGGHAGRRCRHLHHQVGTADHLPQAQRLGHRAFGVVGEVGRAFQADIAVAALGLVEHRLQHIGRGLDVGDREVLVDLVDAVVARCLELLQGVGVFVAFGDRLLEDRRIGGHALQAVALDHGGELAARDQALLEIVQPGGLAGGFELLQRVHVGFLDFIICSLAAATTLSGVKPNFLNRSLAGADAPKPFIAIFAPSRPT